MSSYTAYASPTTYSLAITPTHSLPVSSYLIITFPSQITLAGITVPSCTYTINGGSYTSTSIQTLTTVPVEVEITDAFTTTGFTTPGTFTISCTGFQNPRTTAVTSSFSI